MFFGRFLTLSISLIILMLSIAYCIAQQSTVELVLLTECEPKEPEEIWSHSYRSAEFVDGEPVLSAESQFGETDAECMTTKSITINTDHLWYHNNYSHQWKRPFSIDYQSILFLLTSLYTLSVAMYTAWSMISDVIAVRNGTLHTKCSKYKPFEEIEVRTPRNITDPELDQVPRQRSMSDSVISLYAKIEGLYWNYMGYDTTGWVITSILSEIAELVVQSQAMLLHDGYHPLRPDELYLAQKPRFIRWFAIILFINSSASGLSWLCYAIFPGKCHGLLFLLFIFVIDQICDLFYTLFPLIVVVNDEYNSNTDDILILLGQLNDDSDDSVLSFIASFLPLVLLTTHLAVYSYYAQYELHEQYHAKWMLVEHLKPALDKFKDRQTIKSMFNIGQIATPYKSWIDKDSTRGHLKQCFLVLIAFMYFCFGGITVALSTMRFLEGAESFCDSVKESNWISNGVFNGNFNGTDITITDAQREILASNPELFLWDQCLFKVYPITGLITDDERYRCQCRVFAIDWDEDLESTASERAEYFNLTQNRILEGMLTSWTSLEKFRTTNLDEGDAESFHFTVNMFESIYMKAFEWEYVQIESMSSDISKWKELEHLAFRHIDDLSFLPPEMGQLSNLKSLSFEDFRASSFPISICNLTKLEMLQMFLEHEGVLEVPRCIGQLQNLRVLLLDAMLSLQSVWFNT